MESPGAIVHASRVSVWAFPDDVPEAALGNVSARQSTASVSDAGDLVAPLHCPSPAWPTATPDAADTALRTLELELRRRVGHAAVDGLQCAALDAPLPERLASALALVEALANAAQDAEAEAAMCRAQLRASVVGAPPAAGTREVCVEAATPPQRMPRRLDADLARASFSAAVPPVNGNLTELLSARDALQAELAEREAALQAAHHALSDAQSIAAAGARVDAELALEQANRQVRTLANAVKRAVAGLEAAQTEQRLSAARARAAEEEAAALRAEAQLARAALAKLNRAAAADGPARTSAAADAAVQHQRAPSVLLAERAAVARLQREVEALRTGAAYAASRERELEQAVADALRAAQAPDPELCVLVQELARAEADARRQLADALEDGRLLRERLEQLSAELAAAHEHVAELPAEQPAPCTERDAAGDAAVAVAHDDAVRCAAIVGGSERDAERTVAPPPEPWQDDSQAGDAARAAAAALSASLTALASMSPATAFAPRRSASQAVMEDALDTAAFAPAELSSDDEEEPEDSGPDAVARANAALAAAEQEAAQLTAHEKSLRMEEENAVASIAYMKELCERARSAVAAAAAALSSADADPTTHRRLSDAKARAEQEALRAEDNVRLAEASAQDAAAAAASAADAAAVARATATAKAFIASRTAAAERRHADFRAKLGAVQAQTSALHRQLQQETALCSRVRTEANALVAVLSASGKPELTADVASRAAELDAPSDDDADGSTSPLQAPPLRGWSARLQAAARERDRLTGKLASMRAQKAKAQRLVVDLSERLELMKADAAAGNGARPSFATAQRPAGFFGRKR